MKGTPAAIAGPALVQARRLAQYRAEIARRVAARMPDDGLQQTPYPGLALVRYASPADLGCAQSRPSLAIAVQGAKQVQLGEEVFEYGPANYLVTAFDLPVLARITHATPRQPYLCVVLDINAERLGEVLGEIGPPAPADAPPMRGVALAPVDADLLEPLLRLLRLLDHPADLRALGPLAEREILYRLVTGELGPRLRRLAAGPAHQISRAIDWLQRHYAQPLRIETLAQAVNMSPSSLHHHFKAITAMSPLQYQKQLRLREARRLMLAEPLDAGAAAHRVGYESASQFSREYSRLYGLPPLRDVKRLRCLGDALS
ncbi:AraC family transcriptional regulator [Orrella sp. JC864]|uniref:AraC family transcriptional regulator n=1 Tax=Orrella sp. JC864 TaxID=3120298 RepID=UPI00300BD830